MKKVKKDKKTSSNSKKNHLPIIIGILLSLVTGIAVPLIVDGINSHVNPPVEEEYVPLDPEFLKKPTDGTTPKDHTAIDNYRIAGGVLSLTENFKTEQEGVALSNDIITNKQMVKATRYVNSKKAYVQYSTTSSFVETAVERMYLEDKVIVRNGKFIDDSVIYEDDYDPYVYSYEYILDNIGWLPFSMTSYIINEENIVSSKVLEGSEYPYSMELILDNSSSIAHTKREVRYNANAVTYPKYEQVKVTISMDDDWKVLEIKTEDVYDITVKIGINMTVEVESNLIEKFYYEDCDISSLSSHAYFDQFIEDEVNDEEEIEKEKTAIDYVFNVIFDIILNGTTFDVKAKYQEQEQKGIVNVKMDITNMNGNIIGLFDDFYFKYEGDFYISYLKHNYKFDASFIEHIINALGNVNVEESNLRLLKRQSQEDELMGELSSVLDSLKLEKDGRNVNVSLPIESEEMNFNLELHFFEMDQGTVLKSIKIIGEDLDVTLAPTSKKIEFVEPEYNDLSKATWLVDEMVELASYEGITLHLDCEVDSYVLDANINVKSENKILFEFCITNSSNEEVKIDLYYIDKMFYLELENYMIEVSQEDVEILIGYIASIIEDFTQEEVPEVEPIEEVEDDSSVEEKDILSIIYDVIGTVSMLDDEHINVPLILSSIDENLPDTNMIISVNDEGNLNFNLKDLDVDLEVKEFAEEIILPTSKTVYTKDTIDVLNSHYTNIEEKVSGEAFRLLFDDMILTLEDGEVVINGEYRKFENSYSLELTLSKLFDMKFRVIYLKNKYYVSMGEKTYTFNVALSEKQMETFVQYMDQIFDYILGENDFDASLEEFITNIVESIMAILNGEVDMSLGELLFTSLDIIDSSIVEIDENNIIVEFDETKVQLYKIGDNYFLLLKGIDLDGSRIEGDITLKDGGTSLSVNASDYFDISEIFEDLEIPNVQ